MSEEQEQEWEPITDENHTLCPGLDQFRMREASGMFSVWRTVMKSALPAKTIQEYRTEHPWREWQFRRPVMNAKPINPTQLQSAPDLLIAEPITDRGERYRRRIYQSIDGPDKGKSIIVDLADVFDAFDVPYMLGQAVKKSVLPGERGSKGLLKDLREAAWHIQRQIQIEEAKNQ